MHLLVEFYRFLISQLLEKCNNLLVCIKVSVTIEIHLLVLAIGELVQAVIDLIIFNTVRE